MRAALIIALCSLCIVAAGCTTARPVPLPQVASETQATGIKPGDRVVVRLRSGEIRRFRVTAVDADALIGKGDRIAFADIEKLEHRKFSVGRTAGIVGGVLAAAGGLVLYAALQIESE
jgi:hypothetical protein